MTNEKAIKILSSYKNSYFGDALHGGVISVSEIIDLLSAQPDPAISLSWIEEHIEWLKSLDNEFANLAALHISTMVKKWRGEQE